VKFPTTAQRRRDLGPVKKGHAYGVLVHAMIAVDAPTGACLGLVGGEVWMGFGAGTDFHVLTRAMNDRRLAGGGLLYATMATFPMVGQRTIELPAREPGRGARTARLQLRFGTVEIVRPSSEWDRSLARTVTLRAIEGREIGAPPGVEPLLWRLLTTHAIADATAAWCIIDWYRLRWTIEQLFQVMKSRVCSWKTARSPAPNAWSSLPLWPPRRHASISN
jgi:hypothetical protein